MKQIYTKGFSLVELMVVLGIIAVMAAISFWAMQNRSGHYRVRGTTREMMQLLRLAQASAIRSNIQHRIRFVNATTYSFQLASPAAGGWAAVSGPGRLSIANQTVPQGISFTGIVGNMGCGASYPCQSPRFNADGTISPAGTFGITDTKEQLNVQWTIGGAIRVP